MREWRNYSLRKLIGSPISGSRPTGGISEDREGLPSLGGENIRASGGVTYEPLRRIPEWFFRVMPKGHLRAGDVLINKDGAQTGKVGYFDGRLERAAVNEHLFILRASEETITQKLLYYSLLLPETQSAIARRITGSAQPGLNSQFVDRVRLDVPGDTDEQRRIAEILSTVDEAIEQTEALIAKTQQVKAGLMHDLFTSGVLRNGQLRPPREQAPELYKESPLGWIPREWAYDALGNLTSRIVDGVHHTPEYVEAGIPFVTVKNLTASRSIDFVDLNYISRQDHKFFLQRADPKPGDVLVTKDGTLGVSRIVEPWHPEFSIFVSVALIRPATQVVRPQMIHLFFDSGVFERQLGKLSAGTGLKHIHLEHFRRFAIPLPDLGEQDRIWHRADGVEAKIALGFERLSNLRDIRSGLMHDLLTGRVRVPVKAATLAREASSEPDTAPPARGKAEPAHAG